jgi:hypothetical protein
MKVFRRVLFPLVGAVVATAGLTVPSAGADEPTTLAVEGTLEVVAVDTFGANADSQHLYSVVTDDGATIPVDLDGEQPANGRFRGELVVAGKVAAALDDKDLLPPAGTTIDEDSRAGRVATASAETLDVPLAVASSEVSPIAAAVTTPAPHRAYVAVISNRGTVEETDTRIGALVKGMTDYWVTESGGAISTFALAEPVKRYASTAAGSVAQSCGLMSPSAVWNEARQQFPGISFAAGTRNHLIVAMADECGDAGAAGVARVGTDLSSEGPMTFTLGSIATQVGVHEIGHTFGLGHANLATCPSADVCEYYDLYSTMGLAISGGSFNPPALGTLFRERLGVLAPGEAVQLSQAESDGTFILTPRGGTAGLRGLLVTDPATGAVYSIDSRTRTGRDAGTFYGSSSGLGAARPSYPTGIVIERRGVDGEMDLMTRPGTTAPVGSWSAGTVFAPSAGLRVTVNSTGAAASVRVQLGAVPVVAPTPAPVAAPAAVPAIQTFSTRTPRIIGTVRVGRTLKVRVGSWSPRPAYQYRWYANGRKITRKATKSSFVLTSRQRGKRITVKVTGRKTGYTTVTKTSRRTTKVAQR